MSLYQLLIDAVERKDLDAVRYMRSRELWIAADHRSNPSYRNYVRQPAVVRALLGAQYHLLCIRAAQNAILIGLDASIVVAMLNTSKRKEFVAFHYKKKLDNLRRKRILKSSKHKGIPPAPTGDAAF